MEFVDYNSIIVKHFLLSCVLHGLTASSLWKTIKSDLIKYFKQQRKNIHWQAKNNTVHKVHQRRGVF